MDLIIGLFLFWGAYQGYRRGLLLEIIAVAAFVIAVVVSLKLLNVSLSMLSPYVGGNRRFLPYFGFSVIFFPIVFLVNRLGGLLRNSLRYTLLGRFDSLAGAIVGIFTWAFGVSVFLWLVGAVGIVFPLATTGGSYLYPYIKPIAPFVLRKASVLFPLGGDLIDSFRKAFGV
ncbi:MAG: CvpA family protein [Ferruginibacter sp.]|nr:CvpA family protein [Cytophagales bacterium]